MFAVPRPLWIGSDTVLSPILSKYLDYVSNKFCKIETSLTEKEHGDFRDGHCPHQPIL